MSHLHPEMCCVCLCKSLHTISQESGSVSFTQETGPQTGSSPTWRLYVSGPLCFSDQNKLAIHGVAYLLIMQVARYSTFPNIQPMFWKLSELHFVWRRWLRKKGSKSKNITPPMAYFLPTSSKSIVYVKVRSILLVVLGPSVRTGLLNAISKQLRNGLVPTCFT